jgi:hypothetical protein
MLSQWIAPILVWMVVIACFLAVAGFLLAE